MRTNLVASDKNSEAIIAYIEGFASEALVDKINTGKKAMADCMVFIKEQASQKAINGCAMIEDIEVYGWAMHYFEEDSIQPGMVRQPNLKDPHTGKPVKVGVEKQIEERKAEKKLEAEKKSKDLPGQIDLFQLMGGTT